MFLTVIEFNSRTRNSKFLVDYTHFRDGSISNSCSYTKVKPRCEYDACITKCTILAKFALIRLTTSKITYLLSPMLF